MSIAGTLPARVVDMPLQSVEVYTVAGRSGNPCCPPPYTCAPSQCPSGKLDVHVYRSYYRSQCGLIMD